MRGAYPRKALAEAGTGGEQAEESDDADNHPDGLEQVGNADTGEKHHGADPSDSKRVLRAGLVREPRAARRADCARITRCLLAAGADDARLGTMPYQRDLLGGSRFFGCRRR